MRLLLFDIDGTLILTGEAGLLAFRETMQSVFGAEDDLSRVDFSGATDSGIIRQLFGLHGIDHTIENLERFRGGYFPSLQRWLPARQGRVLPGVHELLAKLREHEHVQLGLLTGNYAEGARLKLQHYGLWEHFPFGAYADDHSDRNELGPFALRRAEAHTGRFYLGRQAWIIGDTPRDIACARACGARVLAVATGRHALAELQRCEPDAAVENLSDYEAVAELLTALD
ncbi:MAG: HAD family hydrolase [Verrucomicrobia bacterium]|nr:HAD family hydrolase [Verrucomicrobiota bacterium]